MFYIYSQDNMNQSLGYAEQSIFKSTQDIHIYSDEYKATELLHIKGRPAVSLKDGLEVTLLAEDTVIDPQTQEQVCVFKRNDNLPYSPVSWKIKDMNGNDIGEVSADKAQSLLEKQQYILSIGESKLAIEITSNFFIQKLSISNVQSSGIDPKIALTAIMLLSSYYADQKQ